MYVCVCAHAHSLVHTVMYTQRSEDNFLGVPLLPPLWVPGIGLRLSILTTFHPMSNLTGPITLFLFWFISCLLLPLTISLSFLGFIFLFFSLENFPPPVTTLRTPSPPSSPVSFRVYPLAFSHGFPF